MMRGMLAASMAGLMAMQAGAGPAAAGVCDEDCKPHIVKLAKKGRQTCYQISATMDGGVGGHAVKRSQQALKETIEAWRKGQGHESGWTSHRVRVQAMRVAPDPYWRSTVGPSLLIKPDVRTKSAYTVCWRGVISPAVCTSGAKLCK